MKLGKILNIKGTLLDNAQLKSYLEKTASDHILKQRSDKETYPIPRLQDNFEFITATYELLNQHLKMKINIHPAGEWLLDNYYIIEETVKTIIKDLSLKKYQSFVSIANGPYKGFARIYFLASEIVAYTEASINSHNLEDLLRAYQNKKTLNMEEIWNIGIFLQIAIIEYIRNICEKIYSAQIQKYKVENILEKYLEETSEKDRKFNKNINIKNKILETGQMKYPFIEYMSYRLKKYGKRSHSYMEILEEQVKKMGTTVSEVIKKEHFDIALKKVAIGNSIKSMKEIGRINFLEIFENINGVEELLKQDPAGIYENMDYKTKSYYRNTIKEISNRTRISELYITNKALELANEYEDTSSKKAHIGYYLISDGIQELYKSLQTNKKPFTIKHKENKYIFAIVILASLLTISISYGIGKQTNIVFAIITFILTYIPSFSIVTQIIQYVLNKLVKPKLIPKMNYENGVPNEATTMVIIPTIVKSGKKAKDLLSKLEVFYLANLSENIYFTLLADSCALDKEKDIIDDEIIKAGIEMVEKLNKKYPKQGLGRFGFIYRKRKWCESEKCFLGWERKRGMIHEFNEYLLGNIKNPFLENTIEDYKINSGLEEESTKILANIKYVITLDADTNLNLNSGIELIGAASHILNKPELNETKDAVINGHAIIQPRVGIDLVSVRKSLFTQIFAGSGGVEPYANAISDIYQDNFGEGIFTGKGIYDLQVFSTVLKNEIPENTVLSHDLLEGNYLRCALASDILLLDGYPYKYNAYISRLHRWIRGDWQIIRWLNKSIISNDKTKKKNPLGTLSKFKILDNLIRSLTEILVLISLLFLVCTKILFKINIAYGVSLMIGSILLPTILDIISYITNKRTSTTYNNFSKSISNINASILRGIIFLAFLPHKAYISLNAIVKTIYRMKVSKQNLLEWTTAEEAEKNGKTDLISYYKTMLSNVIISAFGIFLVTMLPQTIGVIVFYFLFILWIIAPTIAWYISRENVEKDPVKKLKNDEINYVLEIGKKTWGYFEKYMNNENNFLPPDNYQEDRKNKIVDRTSSTNIGLGLMSIISAYDLKYITLDKAIQMIKNVLETVSKLSKWNGHLYNWYNIKTLQPLRPQYISTVDSGNFVGYLFVLRQFLEEKLKNKEKVNTEQIDSIIKTVENLIKGTDFSKLYDYEKRLFSIGFNVEENKLTDSYYDLLASEARQASFVAIAKHDVSPKHWQNLSRTLTAMNGYKGLISWSGTAFEYLMPNINIKKYEGSLLDESCKFMIMSQKEYAKKLGIPWGISESAFNLKDLNSNYQYKAFGIPWLGLKRGLADEMVVSSYGSILAITDFPKEVIENIKLLEKNGMYSKFGFYESIDFTPSRLRNGEKYTVVKTYMAHHQALILLSINNLINNNILQQRFMDNPLIKAVDILLQEKMPEDVIITKEKKEKIEKLKNRDYENYSVKVFRKVNNYLNNYNVISNENYTIAINERGEGFSQYKDILVNRYKATNDFSQGIKFYIKNIRTKKIWSSIYNNIQPDKYEVSFMPDRDQFVRSDGNITTTLNIITAPNDPVEIRSLELRNDGSVEETLEVSSLFEPVLSKKEQDYSHMAFNNLFLKYEYLDSTNSILIKRNKRGNTEPIYLAVNLYTQAETIGELEYEIDAEKLNGNAYFDVPKMIFNSIPFSKNLELVVNPVIALKRTVKIKPSEKVTLNLIITVSEDKEKVEENIKKFMSEENIKKAIELSRVRVEEEARYLGITAKEIENYQKMLSYLIFQNPLQKDEIKANNSYNIEDLWKYGISGDFPILLVKMKEVNDSYVMKEVLKAYEFFRIKNIKIDLVILNEEENVYERYVKEAIETEILNRHLMYLLNTRGGIFILNGNEIDDKNLLEFRANLVIDVHKGNIKTILKELEDDYLDKVKKLPKDDRQNPKLYQFEKVTNLIDIEKLKFYNEYGGFSDDAKEYIIKITKNLKPPVVWSHVIANPNFGSVVTNNNSGYTWYKNSRLNRITEWSNDSLLDTPSEIIYIKDKDYGTTWSLCPNINEDDEEYYMTYGFGYSKLSTMRMGLLQEQETFVPIYDNVKINILRLKNTIPQKRELRIIYYIKPVLGEDSVKTNGYINVKYNKDENIVYANNLYTQDIKESKCYVSSSEKIKSYTGNKKFFFGSGNLKVPEAINQTTLGNEANLKENTCIAIEINIELKAFEDKQVVLVVGADDSEDKMREVAYKYTIVENAIRELDNTKKYWNDLLRTIQIKTPLESMNILLNGWIAYQTIASRLWAKSGFYQSGGAYGFRDQLQDAMGIKYIVPELMKNQIIKHAQHQFIEGDVEHWWHTQTNRGIRTKFSDDLLWLPYVVAEYIQFTGDNGLLEEQISYVKGEVLGEHEDENYDIHQSSEIKESIYFHCIRAIDKGINLGENGLPKIGSGDWNDGFSTVGNKGKGESIWLGFFIYEVLNKFIPICQQKQDFKKVEQYKNVQEQLKKSLNAVGWDGRWFRRAFTDNGEILGTAENEECRIDSISQSWSVISGAADNDKKYISMESLENHLVDKQNGIIKLLDPAFEKSKLEPGYIKAYLPGVRENGGQYTHVYYCYYQFLKILILLKYIY